MSKPEILDLDKLIPQQRIIKLVGKEIDVSNIPSRVTLEIAEKSDLLTSGSPESFPFLIDMVVKVMNDEEVTRDWLIDNTSINQLIALMEFILEPLNERVEGGPKN